MLPAQEYRGLSQRRARHLGWSRGAFFSNCDRVNELTNFTCNGGPVTYIEFTRYHKCTSNRDETKVEFKEGLTDRAAMIDRIT